MIDNNDPQSSDPQPRGWHPTQLAYQPPEEQTADIPEQPAPPPVATPVAPVHAPIAETPTPVPPAIQAQPSMQTLPPEQPEAPRVIIDVQAQPPVQIPFVQPEIPKPAELTPTTPVVAPASPIPFASAFDKAPHEAAKETSAKQKIKLGLPLPGKRTVMTTAFVILATGFISGGIYGYQNMKKIFPPKAATTEENKPPQKVLGLMDTVHKKVPDLPSDEVPSVATVTDVAKLQSQAFFAKAKKGDKVLIYAQNKKAYLFRPSTNEVIEAGAVQTADNKTASDSASTTPASEKPVLKIKF